MHKSLAPRPNIILAIVWLAVVVAGLALPAVPSRLIVVVVGLTLGLVVGVLQFRAMEENRELFLAAESALAVRSAMRASPSGRLAIYGLWTAGVIMLAISIWQQEGLLLRVLVGYAAFALARDAIALRGCFSLQRAYKAKIANRMPETAAARGRGSC